MLTMCYTHLFFRPMFPFFCSHLQQLWWKKVVWLSHCNIVISGIRLENKQKMKSAWNLCLRTTTAKAQAAMRWCFQNGEAAGGRAGGLGGGAAVVTMYRSCQTQQQRESRGRLWPPGCRRSRSDGGFIGPIRNSGSLNWNVVLGKTLDWRLESSFKPPHTRRFSSSVAACCDVSHQLICVLVNAGVSIRPILCLCSSSTVCIEGGLCVLSLLVLRRAL